MPGIIIFTILFGFGPLIASGVQNGGLGVYKVLFDNVDSVDYLFGRVKIYFLLMKSSRRFVHPWKLLTASRYRSIDL